MRKLTQKEFADKVSADIEILDSYLHGRCRIHVRCKKCLHEWCPIAASLTQGHGCPECGKITAAETTKWHLTQEHFLNKIHESIKSNIEILSKYSQCREEIKVKCKNCSRVWYSKPVFLYKGHGCNDCFRKRKGILSRKSHDDFVKEIQFVHGDAITVIGVYETCKTRIRVGCNQCGYIWNPKASNLRRRGCPSCSSSKGERKIESILKAGKIKFEREYKFDNLLSPDRGHLRFDFAIFNKGTLSHLVEYDGKHHFKAIEVMGGEKRYETTKRNDKIKNEYCLFNSIRLVRIPYTMYNQLKLEMLL